MPFSKVVRWNLWGAFLIVFGTVCAALSSGLVHGLVRPIPAAQLLFLKAGLGFLLCTPLLKRYGAQVLASPNKKWHAQKALFGAVGNVLFILALQQLPIADVTTLSLTSALLTTIGAALFFGERMRPVTFVALTLGFSGVILTLTPSLALFSYISLLPLASAVCFTFSSLIVKKVSLVDPMPVSLLYLLFGMAALAAPFVITQWVPLTPMDCWVVAFLALLYVLIQWALIEAYMYGTAGFLAPFKFLRYPLGLVSGVFFFQEAITWHVLIGGVLIMAGCLLIQYVRQDPSHLYQAREGQTEK